MRSLTTNRFPTMLAACLAALSLSAATVAAPALAPDLAIAAKAKKKGKTKKVTVADDYYSPVNLNIKVNDSVNWVWSSMNINSHDVTLKKGPKKVKKGAFSTKTSAVTNARFKKRFTVPGTYDFYCTLHATVMKMKVKVTK